VNLLKQFDGSIDQSGKVLLLDHYMGIGDALWRTCLHRELKRRNPDLKLWVSSIGNYWKPLYKTNSYIDKLVDRVGNPPYTNGVDYYISDRVCPHVVSSYSREMDALDALEIWAGFLIRDKSFVYEVTEGEQEWATKFLSKYSRPIVGVQLKASSWVRNPVPDEIIRLIRMLRYNNCTVVVMDNHPFGFKDDGVINLCGSYDIREVVAIIKNVDAMITPDSGLLHFSGFFKIPTVAIFGGSDPKCRLKYYNTIHPIYGGKSTCNQWPCWSHSYYCPRNINPAPCMQAIKAEDIYNVIKEIL